MIQEKLPEPPLHLSLEMVPVLRSFASDTPSPQLPRLFYLDLSGTLRESSREHWYPSAFFSLDPFAPLSMKCPTPAWVFPGVPAPALSLSFKHEEERLPTKWFQYNGAAFLGMQAWD